MNFANQGFVLQWSHLSCPHSPISFSHTIRSEMTLTRKSKICSPTRVYDPRLSAHPASAKIAGCPVDPPQLSPPSGAARIS